MKIRWGPSLSFFFASLFLQISTLIRSRARTLFLFIPHPRSFLSLSVFQFTLRFVLPQGCSEELLTDKENQHFLFKEPVRLCPEHPREDTFLMKMREALELEHRPGQTLISSAKIKLQLFPVNEEIRTGLEKDGHNPYLELTLSGKKKISSVLRHLETKWGSSSIAKGEPLLFPYSRMGNLSDCKRWTINDIETTAAAVYTAVGSPATFRLKYGWFSIHEPTPPGLSSLPIPYESGVQSGGKDRGCNNDVESLFDERDKIEATAEYKATCSDNVTSKIVAQKMDNAPADPLDNKLKQSCSLQQPWIDSLDNISIGGFLSEVSLLGKFDSKLFGSNATIQTSHLISDSLDAFITSRISQPPVSTPSAEALRTSILDAEETCHAFPLQKLSSRADVQTASGTVACSQDVSPNSLKLPCTEKVNDPDGLSQSTPSEKTQTDLLLSSRLYDDERSLGLTGISWNDSMGPFDLGMLAKKHIGGDSVGIGEFVK
ncbi:TSL-kinase interacting protein 1 isoform X2 [Cicer arietinum]|uniref:TSL-kinase interacting protein 1 isoform X2 n=1 Tax=Cicer arietinum TaxID=3827 RepID=UPI003CC57282